MRMLCADTPRGELAFGSSLALLRARVSSMPVAEMRAAGLVGLESCVTRGSEQSSSEDVCMYVSLCTHV